MAESLCHAGIAEHDAKLVGPGRGLPYPRDHTP